MISGQSFEGTTWFLSAVNKMREKRDELNHQLLIEHGVTVNGLGQAFQPESSPQSKRWSQDKDQTSSMARGAQPQ